jgi:hypothetical protein
VGATRTVASRPTASRSDESKIIDAQSACTNVPNGGVTVADALVALKNAAMAATDVRGIRRALLEVLAALDDDE